MTEKMRKLGEIWSDWNEGEITGDQAISQIHAVFQEETLKVWRERMKKRNPSFAKWSKKQEAKKK